MKSPNRSKPGTGRIVLPHLCALTQQPHGNAGAYSLDALCSPGSSSTDYMQHLVAVSPALHVCRVYLSLNDKWNEEVIVLLLNTGQSTIRHVRAALAPQLSTSRFPALRGTGTPPAESRSELLVFLSETGERLRGDDTLPVASESAMRDFGRHSAVIAQLEIPSADENRMQAVLNWDAAQRARFVAKVQLCLINTGLTIK